MRTARAHFSIFKVATETHESITDTEYYEKSASSPIALASIVPIVVTSPFARQSAFSLMAYRGVQIGCEIKLVALDRP